MPYKTSQEKIISLAALYRVKIHQNQEKFNFTKEN